MRARCWLLVLAVLPSICFAIDWDEHYRRELEIRDCNNNPSQGVCELIRQSWVTFKEKEQERAEARRKEQEENAQKQLEQAEKDRKSEAEAKAHEAEERKNLANWNTHCAKKNQPKIGMTRTQLLRAIDACWMLYRDPTSLETTGAFYETIPLIGGDETIATVHLRNGIVIGIRREAR